MTIWEDSEPEAREMRNVSDAGKPETSVETSPTQYSPGTPQPDKGSELRTSHGNLCKNGSIGQSDNSHVYAEHAGERKCRDREKYDEVISVKLSYYFSSQ